MKKKENNIRRVYRIAMLLAVAGILPLAAQSQTPSITAAASEIALRPNELVTLTFGVDLPVDAYYFGVEVQFDPQTFEFVSELDTGIMTGGITIADLLAGNRVGASVSLTAPPGSAASGDLLALTFRVRQRAAVAVSDFVFARTELVDSNGLLIETLEPAAIGIQVEEGISDLRLTIPAANQIVEGEELTVTGRVYVNDITVNESLESGRVTLWVGVNLTDTDPAGWSELAWSPMGFDTRQDAYHLYQENIGFMMEPGTWYIALRAQLDSQEFVYGGQGLAGGGFWDGTTNSNARLVITETLPFRYVLAGWDFDDESMLVSAAVPANEDALFQVVGADEDGFTSGASGQAASSTGWQFTEGDELYWLAVVSTQGFQNITLSSRQYGTSSSPRDFEIEASLDSLNWELVSPDTLRMASSWNGAVVDNLALPAAYEDQPVVYIRWIRRGDVRVDGTEGITTGDNRIDEVYIRGENINPYEVTVWPGDTDNNGEVDELDVLPLGQYWLSAGPLPIYPGITWIARDVEAWIPEEGSYADANGDGTVDYRDLLPVGLNFGESNLAGKELSRLEPELSPAAELSLPALQSGDRVVIRVQSEEPVEMTGISYRFKIPGVDPKSWRLVESTAGTWGTDWMEKDAMLHFEKQETGYSRAYVSLVHKGRTKSRPATDLVEFVIAATRDWNGESQIILERVIITNNRNSERLNTVTMISDRSIEGGNTDPDLPTSVQLRQNYPNPFNPTTVINYSLPKDGPASMIIYDMLGREVQSLFNGPQKAGTYDLRFDGSQLSSGIYMYRLKAEGKTLTRMFTLIK